MGPEGEIRKNVYAEGAKGSVKYADGVNSSWGVETLEHEGREIVYRPAINENGRCVVVLGEKASEIYEDEKGVPSIDTKSIEEGSYRDRLLDAIRFGREEYGDFIFK